MKYIVGERSGLDLKAAELIRNRIRCNTRKIFTLALPGGSSVSGIFKQLVELQINWQEIQIFLTDERLVPLHHPESNFRLLKENLLAPLLKKNLIPEFNIHSFYTETDDIDRSLQNYSKELQKLGGSFDLVLLSAGEDGHVASLFPEHNSIYDDSEYFIQVNNSPKPPPRRVSVSRKLLLRSQTALLLCYGDAKREALKKIRENSTIPESCPAKLLEQIPDSYLFTDQL